MKKFQLIIVPSSEDEGYFENATSFEDAQEILDDESIQTESAEQFSFDTELEMNCFLQGYHAAIGYNGNGMKFTSTSLNTYREWT